MQYNLILQSKISFENGIAQTNDDQQNFLFYVLSMYPPHGLRDGFLGPVPSGKCLKNPPVQNGQHNHAPPPQTDMHPDFSFLIRPKQMLHTKEAFKVTFPLLNTKKREFVGPEGSKHFPDMPAYKAQIQKCYATH